MVDETRTGSYDVDDAHGWEDRGGIAAGTIVATALAAGLAAYLVHRAREERQPANRMARLAREWTGADGVEAGREFLVGKIVPELKPALLAILEEIEDVVERAFKRAEKNIKRL